MPETMTWMPTTTFVSTAGTLPARPLEAELHDAGELVGVEAGPADQGAVDVGLGHQLGGVGRLHRAAVLDAHRRRRPSSPTRSRDHVADERAHGLGVLGRGGAAGADGPDRLVGDDRARRPARPCSPARPARTWPVDLGLGLPGLALVERLAART